MAIICLSKSDWEKWATAASTKICQYLILVIVVYKKVFLFVSFFLSATDSCCNWHGWCEFKNWRIHCLLYLLHNDSRGLYCVWFFLDELINIQSYQSFAVVFVFAEWSSYRLCTQKERCSTCSMWSGFCSAWVISSVYNISYNLFGYLHSNNVLFCSDLYALGSIGFIPH